MNNKKLYISLGILAVIIVATGWYFSTKRPNYTAPSAERPYRGAREAQIVVEEYGDFQCPACRFAATVVKQLEEKYGYQVKFLFKHYPLTQIHQYALRAALSSECANDQGRFWQYHDALYEGQQNFSDSFFGETAQKLGLDMTQFNTCVDAKAHLDTVRADQDAGDKLRVPGTPTFFVNGQQVDLKDLDTTLAGLTKK